MATVAEVGESGVYFIVRFWVAPLSVARIPIIKENINEKIKRALDEAGIKEPYPHMRLIVDDHNILHIPTGQVETTERIEEDLESAARKN